MREISVCAVQLDHIITDAIDALCSCGELADAALDVILGHRARHRPAGVVRNCGWCLRRPCVGSLQDRLAPRSWRRGRSFTAGMSELHAKLCYSVRPAEIVHAFER